MKTPSSNLVELKLCGQKVALKSHGDPERAREVLELVTERISSAEKRLKSNGVSHHVALLALFELAEDYVQAKHRVSAHQQLFKEKAAEIDRLIQAEFQ